MTTKKYPDRFYRALIIKESQKGQPYRQMASTFAFSEEHAVKLLGVRFEPALAIKITKEQDAQRLYSAKDAPVTTYN